MYKTYDLWNYSDLFPKRTEQEIADLAADIKQNGLKEPLMLYFGQILDGRARYRACQKASVQPPVVEFNVQHKGSDVITYLVNQNLQTRQLNESQRAMVAVKLCSLIGSMTTERAANYLKINHAMIQKAQRILVAASREVIDAVVDGTLSLAKADDALLMAKREIGIGFYEYGSKEKKEQLWQVLNRILRDENLMPEIRGTIAGDTQF